MKERLPLNSVTLKWARESANFLISDIANKLKKDSLEIENWEKGLSSPTYIELEKLAYDIYKRPIAIFFFPNLPDEITPRNSFRTLPDSEFESLPPKFLRLFRHAQVMQINLQELNGGRNPAVKKVFQDLSFAVEDSPAKIAASVRKYLNVSVQTQISWQDETVAFEEWRSRIQKSGIFVFKEAFRENDISGFCLYHPEFPVIYINNSMPKTRQIFTLFHELAHILFKIGGIDKPDTAFLRKVKGENRKIEVICNRFVSEFLVPASDFNRFIAGDSVTRRLVGRLAEKYKVSREVVLRRFLEKGLVSHRTYEEETKVWVEQAKRAKAKKQGGDYYRNKLTYLGEAYLNLAFSRYYQNKMSINQLADYLGMKVNQVISLETVFLAKG